MARTNHRQPALRRLLVLIVAALWLLALASVSAQASTITDNVKVPLSGFGVFVPCANDGAGEVVTLSGTLHLLVHVTIDAHGGVHVKSHAQPQGVSGIGELTGAKYQGTGVTQDHTNIGAAGLPYTFTFVNNFRIIGQGPGNNSTVHENVHVTINANGEVTASVDNFRARCR